MPLRIAKQLARTLYSKSGYISRQLCCAATHLSGTVAFAQVWCKILGIFWLALFCFAFGRG